MYSPLHYAIVAAVDASCTDRSLRAVQICAKNGAQWDEVCDSISSELGSRGQGGSGMNLPFSTWFHSLCQNQLTSTPSLPVEIFRNGTEAVEEFFGSLPGSTNRLRRRKAAILGPNGWGKTTFVNAVVPANAPRTRVVECKIGVEQCTLTFDDPESPMVRHDVTLSDGYGHEAFQTAHAMFFTQRTLYLVCVDFAAYNIALMHAELIADSQNKFDSWMNDFVHKRIIRWIRMVHDHHADAEFVFFGTRADQLYIDPDETIMSIQLDLGARLKKYASGIVELLRMERESLEEERRPGEQSVQLQDVVDRLHKLSIRERPFPQATWIIPEAKGRASAREQFEQCIISSRRSIELPQSFMRVLECLRDVCKAANVHHYADVRTRNKFVAIASLHRAIQQQAQSRVDKGESQFPGIMGLPRKRCETIWKVLHELGDVVWYHKLPTLSPLNTTVIIDPLLLIGFVDVVLAHEPTDLSVRSREIMKHGTLQALPLWKHIGEGEPCLMLPMKKLLQHFQLISPTDREMEEDSDVFVPAYWRTKTHSLWVFGGDDLRLDPTALTSNEPVHIKWEYNFNDQPPDMLFDRFVMASHHYNSTRYVGPDWTLLRHERDYACRVVVGRDWATHRHIIRLEAVAATLKETMADQRETYRQLWMIFKRWGKALEVVVREYRGVRVNRFAFNPENAPMKLQATIREFFSSSLEEYMCWLPPRLEWYQAFLP